MIEEPSINIQNIRDLPSDIKLVVRDGEISTHKALLVMYSGVFDREIKGHFGLEKSEIRLGYETSVDIMGKLINSFYARNTSEMIRNESYKNKLELLRICNYYQIDVPILAFLEKMTVKTVDEAKDFVNTINPINPSNEEWQSYIIAAKISKKIIFDGEFPLSEEMTNFILDRLSYLVTVTAEEVIFTDLALNEDVFKIEGKDYTLASYSRNKQRLALLHGHQNRTIEIWEMRGVEPYQIYEGNISNNYYYGISPDGSCFASANHSTEGEKLIITEISDNAETKSVKIKNIPKLVTISPSNNYAACYICYDLEEKECEMFIVDLNEEKVIKQWKSNSTQTMAFTSDTSFVTLDTDGSLNIYLNFVGDEITNIREKDFSYFEMCVTMDKIILINSEKNINIMKLTDGNVTITNGFIEKQVIELDKTYHGRLECSDFHIAYFSRNRRIDVYDLVFGKNILQIKDPKGTIQSVTL